MLNEILSGWKNFIQKSKVTENTARKRAAMCALCPHATKGKLLVFIKDNLKEIQGTYCNICKCPLSAKVRSNDICPENKW
ncbi:hypothetical protein ABS768_05555 [Flavobacterium sp. ST-75]|uniref:Uncharacterized protein n=1 Tax=Flavobacterium rhizophilum TaxID=3163296 RepID=A0ABW8YCI4_9FLAO